MIKCKMFFLCVLLSCILCSCATADMDTQATEQTGIHVIEDMETDMDRHISDSYGDSEGYFKIDADVTLPDTQIQKGTFEIQSIDISLIEQFLCNGEKLQEARSEGTDDSQEDKRYVSSGNEVDNDLDYDLLYWEQSGFPGYAQFTNFRIDKFFSGDSFLAVPEEEWSAEQQTFVDSMIDKGRVLFDNLNIECELANVKLEKGDNGSYCMLSMNTLVNGIPFVYDGKFIQSNINIGDSGINDVSFCGRFKVVNAEDATILSVDEVLDIVKKGVEEKHINACENNIESIRLAYMVNTDREVIEFYPVWCFSVDILNNDKLIPFLCINAQNGTIVNVS